MKLRSKPIANLSVDAVKIMLKKKGFFHVSWNQQGQGFLHRYESVERNGAKLVIDHAIDLTWQRGGSKGWMTFADAQKYLKQLNREKFAGYSDWRLPTLEEATSLIESTQNNGDLYIDPLFNKKQEWIWIADKKSARVAWIVSFVDGGCDAYDVYNNFYVRAVRSWQS